MGRTLPPTLRELRWIPLVLWALILLGTVPRQDDVWWRMAAGRDMVRTHSVPHTNDYAFTEPDHPWVDHAWAYDLGIYGVYSATGLGGVHLVHALALFLLGLALFAPQRGRDLLWALPAVLLLWSHHSLRPWAVSDLLFLTALLLARDRGMSPLRRGALLFGLFALWGNLHGSAVPGALAVLVLLIPAQRTRESLGTFALTALALGAALMANPYGLGALALSVGYLSGHFSFLEALEEWGPPPLHLVLTLMAFTMGLGLALRHRRIPWRPLILSAILLVFSLKSRRHIPLFVITSLALLVPRIPSLRSGSSLAALALFALLAVGRFALGTVPVEERFYPRSTYVRIEGRIGPGTPVLAPHAWGGSLIWHFDGRARPYIDARNDCYSPKTFQCYRALREASPAPAGCPPLPPGTVDLLRGRPSP